MASLLHINTKSVTVHSKCSKTLPSTSLYFATGVRRATAWYAGPAYQAVTYTEWYIPDDVLIQLILLMMSTGLLETCREVK